MFKIRSLNSEGSIIFQQTSHSILYSVDRLPQVPQLWCRFTMGSVNLSSHYRTTWRHSAGCVLSASATTASRRNTGSQTQLGPLVKAETVIDMAQSTTTVVTSVRFTSACVCTHVCVCVRSFCVCHAPLPPPVCLAHFLHRLPPRYFMSESFYSSHLRIHFSV